MPGQVLQNFLNQGAAQPGKAAPTVVIANAQGSPQQKAVAKAQQQAAIAQRAAAHAQQQAAAQAVQQGMARQQAAQEELNGTLTDIGTQQGQRVLNRLNEGSQKLTSWADRVPTPGGIGVLLLLIFLFLWAIVPVNGQYTRLQLMWLTLTGRTKMASTPDAANTPTGGNLPPNTPFEGPFIQNLPVAVNTGTGVGDFTAPPPIEDNFDSLPIDWSNLE